MKDQSQSILTKGLKDQSGQTIVWVGLMMIMLMSMAAFAIDIGHAYFCFRELQAATDAAALAGAHDLRNSDSATVATQYSAVSGSHNSYANLGTVTMVSGYPKFECLTTIENMNIACSGANSANTIQVKQQAVVPTYFAGIFGVRTFTLTATSTASITTKTVPFNVVILIDTTQSMNTTDTNCGNTRIKCALNGVQNFLVNLDPCYPSQGTCTVSNGVANDPLDQVAIFTFPNPTIGTVSDDYNCSGTNPTTVIYTLPSATATSYSPSGNSSGTYQVTPFLSDYRASAAVSTLSTSSDLSMALGAGKKNGNTCPGMGAPGGDGTYYAGAIYAAQAALTAQFNSEGGTSANPIPQNIMIILSDGEANASSSKMNSSSNTYWNSSGYYPSAVDQCQQAVAAAAYAKSQGTLIYTVAYGSESTGCTTDTTGAPAASYLPAIAGVNEPNISPCDVMSQMASGSSYFYSDYNQSGANSTCVSTGNSVSDLNGIFSDLAENFMGARLIPDNTQ